MVRILNPPAARTLYSVSGPARRRHWNLIEFSRLASVFAKRSPPSLILNTESWQAMTDVSSPRQHPGLACEECRRRKARCDRVRPKCGICAEVGQNCVVVDKRPPRGPKKGQIQELQSRLGKIQADVHTSGAHGRDGSL